MSDLFGHAATPIVLREYQSLGIRLLRESIAKGNRSVLYVLPTGGGKTSVAADMIRSCREKGGRSMFLAPRRELVYQASNRLRSAGIPHGVLMAQASHLEDLTQSVQVCSIDTLIARMMRQGKKIELPDFSLIILDEAHLAVTERRKDLLQYWPKAVLVGLTATPIRKDGRALGMMFEDMVTPTSVKELVDIGHLVPARYFSISKPDLKGVKVTAGDYNAKQLDDAMNRPTLVGDVVQHWLEHAATRRTVVFCTSIKHSVAVCEQFQRNGVAAEHVDANTPTDEREQIFKRFTSGKTQVLCNCFLASYGFDLPELSCVVLARPTKSLMLYCLDKETEILTSHGWKGADEIQTGDCVAACEGAENAKGLWASVTGVVERDMQPDEAWVEYSAPRANFRVTDQHRMIFKGAHDKGAFRISTAKEMAECKGGAKMPTAVIIDQVGVPLTDSELYFIGMMMADGSWTSTRGYISQSERHPAIIEKIEQSLKGCGIGYGKRKSPSPPADSEYKERFPRWQFHFSAGKPKAFHRTGNDNNLGISKKPLESIPGETGYRHLIPFLDKDFSPALMQISKRQLLTLIDGIWDGDGLKKIGVDYIPHTFEICSGRKIFVDRLQALCAINGMTASISVENGPSRKNPMYRIYITDKDWRHCGGYASASRNPRPQIEIKPATNERVWCVETTAGTIVTRRRGRVTVMGNCQMIGRGLRPADGKKDCLVLDHSGCVHQHGFADQPRAWSLDGLHSFGDKKKRDPKEAKEVVPIECPECKAVFSKSPTCPECGYQLKVVGQLIETADGKLIEMASGFEVDKEMGTPQFYQELKAIAEEKGYKPGWASVNYKDKFGDWPPREWNHLEPLPPTTATRRWLKSKTIAWIRGKKAAEQRAQA